MRVMITVLALLMAVSVAHAGIRWTWVNAGTGTERGTFITNGQLVGNLAPPGTYTVADFSVTASCYGLAIGTYSGGAYLNYMPEAGFDWDGSDCTCFWRDSGAWTNGFNYHVTAPQPGAPDCVCFSVDYFMIDYDETVVYLEELQTPVLTPEATVTTNDASTLGAVKLLYR